MLHYFSIFQKCLGRPLKRTLRHANEFQKRFKLFFAAQFAVLQKCYESISIQFMPLVCLYTPSKYGKPLAF